MGISFSSNRRNQNHHPSYYNQPPPPPPPPPPYYYSPSPPIAPPPPSDPSIQPPPPPYYQYNYSYNYNYQYPPNPATSWYNNAYNYGTRPPNNNNFQFFNNPGAGSGSGLGLGWGQAPVTPPPYVEHQSAKVVKNDVNVHKDTIKLDLDHSLTSSSQFLVSFVFDAHFDGSITVYYFAKEDKENLKFTPVFSTATSPISVPFEKGTAQKFQQPPGTGVDLGFFDLESLGKPTEDGVFPLVIFAEVNSSSQEGDNDVQEPSAERSRRVQVTQAIIEKKNDGAFQVKVVKQILWIDGVRYELRDLYGIGNASSEGFNDDDPGKECVICLTEPKNTAVIPCRHLCLCSDCAKELRLRSNKCPICRQPITEFMEIKISNTG